MKLVGMVSRILRDAEINSVVLGLSGGADSVALLRLLVECGVSVNAIHCNFHLRGPESDRDMMFCVDLCHALDLPLKVYHFDTQAYIRSSGLGLEEACRELRYDRFRQELKATGADRIAIAHNADDNIETLLLNLFRGSGISGLRGILPDTGEIIRPLLAVHRAEITDYLQDIEQNYIVDSSNLESDYKRNFIRNELLPLVETRWPGVRKAMTSTLVNLRSDEMALDFLADNLPGGVRLSAPVLPYDILSETPCIRWILHRWCSHWNAPSKTAYEIADSFLSPDPIAGKEWRTSEGSIVAGRDALYYMDNADIADADDFSDLFNIETLEYGDDLMTVVKSCRKPDDLWTALPPERCRLRRPVAGDRIKPLGMSGSSLVSDVLKDAGLNPVEKSRQLLLEDSVTGEIIWIPGIKRSRLHLITPDCTQVYHWSMKE